MNRLRNAPRKTIKSSSKEEHKTVPGDYIFRLAKDEFIKVITNCDHLQNLKYGKRTNNRTTKTPQALH